MKKKSIDLKEVQAVRRRVNVNLAYISNACPHYDDKKLYLETYRATAADFPPSYRPVLLHIVEDDKPALLDDVKEMLGMGPAEM